jgi:lysophospholipase L1-like esterase
MSELRRGLDAGATDGGGAAPLRRGLVALGDSITNGRGEPWMGVPAQSWAQWVAEALELPFTKLARDGARSADILRDLAPRLDGPYDVACVYAGVNDARSLDWDAAAYERDLRALVAAATDAADRVLLCTLPADLGRPSCAPKSEQASAIVREIAAEAGALVVPLDDFGGRRDVLPDVIHPTAWGQVEIAARAVLALRAGGLSPRREVWTLAEPQLGARAAFAAERRWLALLVQDLRRRTVERVRD